MLMTDGALWNGFDSKCLVTNVACRRHAETRIAKSGIGVISLFRYWGKKQRSYCWRCCNIRTNASKSSAFKSEIAQ